NPFPLLVRLMISARALALGVLSLVLSGTIWHLQAQAGVAQVAFDVTLPANTPDGDTIYVAGNFQNWDPGAIPLTRDSATHAHGTIATTEGNALEFKFTRGDWGRVEKAIDCSEIPNRTATATNNRTITVTVANWADICIPVYDNRARK